ncbi:MAG TPA: hypothetical protein VGJ86_03320 [Acidimicrobiales bacterium]|jgi:hypothetical protein
MAKRRRASGPTIGEYQPDPDLENQMPDSPSDSSSTVEATEPEGDEDYSAYVGAPLDPDYLARISQEADK